jgi:membrane-associated phospholipid phosphatase
MSPLLAVAALVIVAPRVDYAVDGSIIAAALAVGAAASFVPVDTAPRWSEEPFALDESVKHNFSRPAAWVSDGTILAVVAVPLALLGGEGFVETSGKNLVVYAETLALNYGLNSATKYAVQRPRPYSYSADASVQAYTETEGADAHLSFYSGHASTSFAAAVSGSYLYAMQSSDVAARAWVWGAELLLASATTTLRVRAGKHYYSDVLLGVAVGIALGVAVPYAHAERAQAYRVGAVELGAMAGGLASGVALAALLPAGEQPAGAVSPLSLAPWVWNDAVGLRAAVAF